MTKGGRFKASSVVKNKAVRVTTVHTGIQYETCAHMDGYVKTLVTTHSDAKASWNHRTWVLTAYLYSIEALSTIASLAA